MIMAALLGVVRALTGQLRRLESKPQDRSVQVSQILHQDAVTTSQISRRGEAYHWFGNYASVEPIDAFHGKIIYECRPWLDGEMALVRQVDSRTDVVAKGIHQIVIERMDSRGVPQPISRSRMNFPGRIKVWLWIDQSEIPSAAFEVVVY